MKFCQFVAILYFHTELPIFVFILIFNQMALIFLGVLVFTILIFKLNR